MASSSSCTMVQALQGIVSTSSNIGIHVVTAPPIIQSDFHLPSAPPISSLLINLGLGPVTAAKLSRLYEDIASQLRHASEAKWRHTLHACFEINQHFGIASHNAESLRSTAIAIYRQNLHQMKTDIVALCQKHVQQSGRSLPINIARPIAPTPQTSVPFAKYLDYCATGTHCSEFPRDRLAHFPAVYGYNSSLNVPLRLPDHYDSAEIKSTSSLIPVYKSYGGVDEEDNQLIDSGAELHMRPYPARYTHPVARPSRTLPCNSGVFFPKAREVSPRQQSLDQSADQAESVVFARLGSLSLQDENETQKSCHKTTHALPLPDIYSHEISIPSIAESSMRLKTSRSPSPTISLSSTVDPHKGIRRRVAALPRRAVHASQHPPASPAESQHCGRKASPSSTSSQVPSLSCFMPSCPEPRNLPPCTSASPIARNCNTSASETRRRKTLPLPRRQPSRANVDDAASLVSAMRPTSTYSPFIAVQTLPTIQRTPSLVSLSSSRSASPSPSDDSLDTPPPSPTMHACNPTIPACSGYGRLVLSPINEAFAKPHFPETASPQAEGPSGFLARY